jgi:hypothetical protein
MAVGEKSKIWQCIKKNRHLFLCKGMAFNSTLPGYKNNFEGWAFRPIATPNYGLIALYLEHIRRCICGGDEAVYAYVMKWIAFIVQHPGLKTLTALVLIGPQGSGKNLFTNQIAAITAPYSERNIDDINDIVSRFNGVLENVVLAICNEMKSDKRHKLVDTNKLKSAITEREVRVERKFKDKVTIENVANFVFLSNNFSPFKQDVDDRRNLDLQVVMPEDPASYFEALGAEVDGPLFHQTLFTYLLNYEVPADYDFVHNLPMTTLKLVIQGMYKSPFELFITRHWQLFVDGWPSASCKAKAQAELIANIEGGAEAKEYKTKGLTLDLQKYCGGAKQVRRGDGKQYVYQLLPNYVRSFKPTDEQVLLGEVDPIAVEDCV